MQELLPPWNAYLRLQTRSQNTSTVDSYSWGLEAEMSLFLEDPSAFAGAEVRRLERANAAAARRARAQGKTRKDRVSELAPEPIVIDRQLEAREALTFLEAKLSPENWLLLLYVAEGHSYADIAKIRGAKAGTLRVLTSRLRSDYARYSMAA